MQVGLLFDCCGPSRRTNWIPAGASFPTIVSPAVSGTCFPIIVSPAVSGICRLRDATKQTRRSPIGTVRTVAIVRHRDVGIKNEPSN